MRDEYIIAKGVYTDQGVTRFWICRSCGKDIALKCIPLGHTPRSWFPIIPHLCSQHGIPHGSWASFT